MIVPKKEKRHPRYGYCVALFLGTRIDHRNDKILVEIHETYNVWADEHSKSYHYRPYDITDGKQMEIKTIGFIGPFDEKSEEPPSFVLG